MTQTTKATQIVPEVYAAMLQAEYPSKLVFGSVAARYDQLVGQAGETIYFPQFGLLSEMETLSETSDMTPEAMSTSSSTATIQEVGKAVEITDKALLTAFGNPLDESRRQLAILAASRIDTDLIVETNDNVASSNSVSTEETLSTDLIIDGIAKFGDDMSNIAAIFFHSYHQADLWKTSEFKDASKLGKDIPLLSGQIGTLFGTVPVVVTDKMPTNFSTLTVALTAGASTVYLRSTAGLPSSGYVKIEDEIIAYSGKTNYSLTTCTRGAGGSSAATHTAGLTVRQCGATGVLESRKATALAVKNGALGLAYKREPIVETDRDILARSTIITTNIHYAVKLVKTDKALKITSKLSLA